MALPAAWRLSAGPPGAARGAHPATPAERARLGGGGELGSPGCCPHRPAAGGRGPAPAPAALWTGGAEPSRQGATAGRGAARRRVVVGRVCQPGARRPASEACPSVGACPPGACPPGRRVRYGGGSGADPGRGRKPSGLVAATARTAGWQWGSRRGQGRGRVRRARGRARLGPDPLCPVCFGSGALAPLQGPSQGSRRDEARSSSPRLPVLLLPGLLLPLLRAGALEERRPRMEKANYGSPLAYDRVHVGNDCRTPPDYWTIHGLWADRAEACNRSWHFNFNEIKDLLQEMNMYWPDILHSPANHSTFWKHEWEKHGTCVAQLEALNSEQKYFGKGLDLYKGLGLNSMLLKLGIRPSGNYYQISDIKDALASLYGVVPKIQCLPPEQDEEVQALGQIELCFTKDLQLRNCTEPGEPRESRGGSGHVPPVGALRGLAACEDGPVYYPPPPEGGH